MTYASRLQRTRGREDVSPRKRKRRRERKREIYFVIRGGVAWRETALGFWYARRRRLHTRLESDLCGTGSPRAPRGGAHAFESRMRHIHIPFLLFSLRPRVRPHAPDVARDATLFATRSRLRPRPRTRRGRRGENTLVPRIAKSPSVRHNAWSELYSISRSDPYACMHDDIVYLCVLLSRVFFSFFLINLFVEYEKKHLYILQLSKTYLLHLCLTQHLSWNYFIIHRRESRTI